VRRQAVSAATFAVDRRRLSLAFETLDGHVEALSTVDLQIESGDFVVLLRATQAPDSATSASMRRWTNRSERSVYRGRRPWAGCRKWSFARFAPMGLMPGSTLFAGLAPDAFAGGA
jgi:hypothetical protein